MSTKMDSNEVNEMFATISDSLTDIPRDPNNKKFKKRDALKIANDSGAPNLTLDKITYIINQGLINPMVIEGDRDTHYYGRDHIANLILISKLRDEKKLTYTQISNLLREDYRFEKTASPHKNAYTNEIVLPPQGKRGIFLLRSRIMAIIFEMLTKSELIPATVFIFRELKNRPLSLPNGASRVEVVDLDSKQATDLLGKIRDDDLFGYVTSYPDQEILFPNILPNHVTELNYSCWKHLQINLGGESKVFDFIFGFPEEVSKKFFIAPTSKIEKNIMALLSKTLMLDLDLAILNNNKEITSIDQSALLNILVEVIPNISDKWEYCAVFTSDLDHPDNLRISAHSQDVPKDLKKDIEKIIIEPGQLITGWVFDQNQLMIVQKTIGEKDPRLVYQNLEQAMAAIALPTRAQNSYNGVLYIGTRFPAPKDEKPFEESEIRVLRLMAEIIGEIIERNRIRKTSVKESEVIISLPPLSCNPWENIDSELKELVESIICNNKEYGENEIYHITVVRIDTYSEIEGVDFGMAVWLGDTILTSTREFFLQHGLGDPKIFLKNSSSKKEFVCLIPHTIMTDNLDRSLRISLREILNSIKIRFSFKHNIEIVSNVWSMPFRYRGLVERMKINGKQSITTSEYVQRRVNEIDQMFFIVPHIEEAHKHEANGAYKKSIELYLVANNIAPKNNYIIRHLAKNYAIVGDFINSAKWWEELISIAPNANHHLRYGNILGHLGKYPEATKFYDKAHKLDRKNPNILIEFANFLAIIGDHKNAIDKYQSALKMRNANREFIWLRLAETHYSLRDYNEAMRIAKMLMEVQPNNLETRSLILRILHKRIPNER